MVSLIFRDPDISLPSNTPQQQCYCNPIENQAGIGEKSKPIVNKDDKRSEKEQTGIEDTEVDGESEAAVESYTQMSTMSSEYAHPENDSDNNLESLGSLSDGEDSERTESFIPKLYVMKPKEFISHKLRLSFQI